MGLYRMTAFGKKSQKTIKKQATANNGDKLNISLTMPNAIQHLPSDEIKLTYEPFQSHTVYDITREGVKAHGK